MLTVRKHQTKTDEKNRKRTEKGQKKHTYNSQNLVNRVKNTGNTTNMNKEKPIKECETVENMKYCRILKPGHAKRLTEDNF